MRRFCTSDMPGMHHTMSMRTGLLPSQRANGDDGSWCRTLRVAGSTAVLLGSGPLLQAVLCHNGPLPKRRSSEGMLCRSNPLPRRTCATAGLCPSGLRPKGSFATCGLLPKRCVRVHWSVWNVCGRLRLRMPSQLLSSTSDHAVVAIKNNFTTTQTH